MRQYSWLVVLFAVLGFATSLVIHITAYFRLIPAELFLLYCRAEWLGVAFVAILLGVLMPTDAPRRQIMMLLRWMVAGSVILFLYLLYCGAAFVTGEHPRRADSGYVVVRGNRVVRTISSTEYERLAAADSRFYNMSVNRAFSAVWVTLFFGIGLHGIGYMRGLRRLGLRHLSPERFVPWWYVGG
jgi:hypothetical protein